MLFRPPVLLLYIATTASSTAFTRKMYGRKRNCMGEKLFDCVTVMIEWKGKKYTDIFSALFSTLSWDNEMNIPRPKSRQIEKKHMMIELICDSDWCFTAHHFMCVYIDFKSLLFFWFCLHFIRVVSIPLVYTAKHTSQNFVFLTFKLRIDFIILMCLFVCKQWAFNVFIFFNPTPVLQHHDAHTVLVVKNET